MALQDLLLSSRCKCTLNLLVLHCIESIPCIFLTFEITLSLCYGRTLSNNLIGGSIPELPPTLVNMYVIFILNMI